MNVKLQTEHHFECLSLKGGCTGSSESTLVKYHIFWKSHVAAHIRTHKGVEAYAYVNTKFSIQLPLRPVKTDSTSLCQ